MDAVLYADHSCVLGDYLDLKAYVCSARTQGNVRSVQPFLDQHKCGPCWCCAKHEDPRCRLDPCRKDRHDVCHWGFRWHHHLPGRDLWSLLGAHTGWRRRAAGCSKLVR